MILGGAEDLFTTWAAQTVRHLYPTERVFLVPLPNSGATTANQTLFRTEELSRAIAATAQAPVFVAVELRWSRVLPKASSEGGSRRPEDLFPHLVAEPTPVTGPRVLIDDVFTSGGHIQAAAAKLRKSGLTVDFAICCGRTLHEQVQNPFGILPETLDDYDPDDTLWGLDDWPEATSS